MQKIKTEPLRRCPFCGGEAEVIAYISAIAEDAVTTDIRCKSCHMGTSVTSFNGSVQIGEESHDHVIKEVVEEWNRRAEPDITDISDDLLEISLLSERAAAAADELQQDYFGIRTEEVKKHSAGLVYRYDRGRVLSNIAADYAYRANKLIEELDEKLTSKEGGQA